MSELPQFPTRQEERDYYSKRAKEIDSQLVSYSQAAFSAVQAKIRREFPLDSFARWMNTKSRMERERRELVREKAKIERELARLKPLVREENIQRFGTAQLTNNDLAQIMQELREIRAMLEAMR